MAANFPPSALLHFDGDSGSTSIVDVMQNAWTPFGDAKLTTADSKFGGACLALDGAGDYVTANGASNSAGRFVFEGYDFTLEAWIKPANTGHAMEIIDFYVGGQPTWQMELNASGQLNFYGWNGSATATLVTGSSVLYGAWHHVAISKKDNVLYACVDGVVEASAPHTASFTYQPQFLAIGAQVSARNPAYDFAGLIDEVRVSKQTGRYSAAFTPPTAPFPDEAIVLVQERVSSAPGGLPGASFGGLRMQQVSRLYKNFFILGAEARLIGTVKEKHTPDNTPLRRLVRVIRERDGAVMGVTWSDATTGAYAFTNIDSAEAYTVIAYDHEHNHRAVVADNLTVAGGGVELVA